MKYMYYVHKRRLLGVEAKKNPGDLLEIAYFRHNVDCTTFFYQPKTKSITYTKKIVCLKIVNLNIDLFFLFFRLKSFSSMLFGSSKII